MNCCRLRKREHVHTLQMRLSALKQENRDFLRQVAFRDAELKQFNDETGKIEGTLRPYLDYFSSMLLSCLVYSTTL